MSNEPKMAPQAPARDDANPSVKNTPDATPSITTPAPDKATIEAKTVEAKKI